MTRIILPMFLREEANELTKQLMQFARMLQVRLIDADRQHDLRADKKVRGADIVRVVGKLDCLAQEVSDLVGGTRALKQNEECMRHTLEFAAYCERSFAYEDSLKRKRKKK